MPVIRKKMEIQPNSGAGAVQRSADGSMSQGFDNIGSALARKAASYAAAMGAAAEDEATQLARQAVFSTGPSGLPEMPENPTKRMGTIAARTYDRAITDRMTYQLQVAVKNQINEAHQANMYDFDAFAEDANERISTMAADIPEGYEGVFQQLTTSAMVDTGATIGFRQAQLVREDAKSQYPAMLQTATGEMRKMIEDENDDEAKVQIARIEELLETIPMDHMTTGQKQDYMEEVLFEAGVTRMVRDLGLRDATPSQLTEISAALLSGELEGNEKLMNYFTFMGEDAPRFELVEKAGRYINSNLMQASTARAKAAKDALLATELRRTIVQGGGTGTAKEQAALGGYIGEQIGLRTESGGVRPITTADWRTLSGDQLTDAVQLSKTAGFLDKSLEQYLRSLNNGNAPGDLVHAYEIYENLRDAPNVAGQVVDYTDKIPAEVLQTFGLAEVLHGDGNINEESVADAMSKIQLLDPNWTDEHLAQLMRKNDMGSMFGESITAENARDRFSDQVIPEIFDGVDAYPAEKDQARKAVETYMRLGVSFDDAIDATEQLMRRRHVETKYMVGYERSAWAPEKHYPEPPASSVGELGSRVMESFSGNTTAAQEWFAGVGIPDWLLGERGRIDMGSSYMLATPFERMANSEIKKLIEARPDGEALMGGLKFLKGGEDYQLTPIKGEGKPPVYNVVYRGENGLPIPLGRLDMREEWGKYTEFNDNAAAILEFEKRKRNEYATDPVNIAAVLAEGGNPSMSEMWKRYDQIRFESKK